MGTYTIRVSESATAAEVERLVIEAFDKLGLDKVAHIIRDNTHVHLCITATCPYCSLTFENRSFLADHIDNRLKHGDCFSS